MIYLSVPESVEESFTLLTRFNHLELVMMYCSFDQDRDFTEELFASVVEDFVADLSDLRGPTPVIQAIKLLHDLVARLDQRTQELIERDYAQDVKDCPDYLRAFGEAAWAKAFDELCSHEQDYKQVFKTSIDYIFRGLDDDHPEIAKLPAFVFLKLASTPMLETSISARLFEIWRAKRGV